MKLKRLIGDKKFYMMVLAIAVPLIIQNGITNFVSLLDNIMVGRTGTEPMSGVAIVNQILFVYNLALFGAVSGPSIFGAQFYGKRDFDGMRGTFRFKMIICTLLSLLCVALMIFKGPELVSLYLESGEGEGDPVLTLAKGSEYLKVMILGLIPFAVTNAYVSTLREMGEIKIPMIASIIAVGTNLIGNYILIFGNFGAPEMGVVGAAVATVISRYVEMLIVVIWTHAHSAKYPFIVGAYRSLHIEKTLVKDILIKGMPLLVNETMWAFGMALIAQCYSLRGIEAIAAQNIASTISNLFNVIFISLGSSIGIVVGPMLGANELEEAKDTAYRMIAFSVVVCVVIGLVMAATCRLFPMIYNTTALVREIASKMILISALLMPIFAFTHASYFTLRTGGKTLITFLFDSAFHWTVVIPTAYLLTHLTPMPIIWLYLCVQGTDILKCVLGFILIKKGVWVNNIVSGN